MEKVETPPLMPSHRNWLRFSLRDAFFVIALCAVCLGWHADRRQRTLVNQPSPTFAAFDIAKILAKAGFNVQQVVNEEITTNSATGRAQILSAGTFRAPANGFNCFIVLEAVNKQLNADSKGFGHQEGWMPVKEEHPGKPVRICTFYNHGKRHGELQLWLFPNQDESELGFALHLVEAPLE